jgi:hypothetical protein
MKVLPNTKTCVNCSTEEKWSGVPVIYHKTGNTIEIVKNSETAEQFRKLSSRAGFGTLRGMKGKQSKPIKTVKNDSNVVGTTALLCNEKILHEVGEQAMRALDIYGIEKSKKIIADAIETRLINKMQGEKILNLIELTSNLAQPEKRKKTNKVVDALPETSEDIKYIFRNWKK